MENNDIRLMAKGAGVPLWRIADYIGVSEATLTRLLRKPLDDDTKRQLMSAIDDISQEVAS